MMDFPEKCLSTFKRMDNDGTVWVNFALVLRAEKCDQGWTLYFVGGDKKMIHKNSVVATWLESKLPAG